MENLTFLIYFFASASPFPTIFDDMLYLDTTESSQALRCCAEGVLSCSKIQKLMIKKL